MESIVTGKAYVLGDNIDTDQIIPAQYLSYDPSNPEERKFFGMYANSGVPEGQQGLPGGRTPFVKPGQFTSEYQIIIGGKNFGCGSSREHAPWAIEDYGFRVVIAPSFADIFFGNCYKSGILPIVASHAIVDQLFRECAAQKGYRLRVDLETQTVRNPAGEWFQFDITPHRKHCLMNGLDEIGLTLQHADEIKAFEAKHKAAQPWLF